MIPRQGGGAIGCFQATGVKPLFHLSYSDVSHIDLGITNYWPDVPYYLIDKNEGPSENEKKDIDFVFSVCPCNGLSTAKITNSDTSFYDESKSQIILDSSEYVLKNISPKVLFGENGEGLFNKRGQVIVEQMKEIAEKYNYSFSLYLTNLIEHGRPSKRTRTFYFFWKNNTAPVLNYIHNKFNGKLIDFFANIPEWSTLQDIRECYENPCTWYKPYQFLLEHDNLTHQECIRKYNHLDLFKVLKRNNLMDECIEWLEKNYPDVTKAKSPNTLTFLDKMKRYKAKFDQDKGIFDDTPYFSDDYLKCIVRKNIKKFIHPVEERYLNMREYLTLMGFPFDFEPVFTNKNKSSIDCFQIVSKGVPVMMAKDICSEVVKYLNGELENSNSKFLKQNNLKNKIELCE